MGFRGEIDYKEAKSGREEIRIRFFREIFSKSPLFLLKFPRKFQQGYFSSAQEEPMFSQNIKPDAKKACHLPTQEVRKLFYK